MERGENQQQWENDKQNWWNKTRKGRNVQYNGKILSQCINSSDSSFSSFLSAPKKKEFRWEASSLEVESARYSKTTNYHASFLRHIHPSSKQLRTLLCTRQFSAGHNTGQYHMSGVVLSTAMHIQMHPTEKKHKPTKQTKKSLHFHLFQYPAPIISIATPQQ